MQTLSFEGGLGDDDDDDDDDEEGGGGLGIFGL